MSTRTEFYNKLINCIIFVYAMNDDNSNVANMNMKTQHQHI